MTPSWLLTLFARRRFEREIDEELQFHLEMEARKNAARGLDPRAAREEAEQAFGGIARVKEDLRAVRGLSLLDAIGQDLRSATRALRRAPGTAIVVAITLALGIGVNTALFSVVREALLTPPRHLEAHGLLLLARRAPGVDGVVRSFSFSVPELEDFRRSTRAFDGIAEYHSMSFTRLGEDGRPDPELIATGIVSPEFFDLLGVRPLHGRSFLPGEDEPAVLLGYEYWRQHHGADPRVIGREIAMNDRVHRIVGVLPPLPRFPEPNDVFMPVSSCPFRSSEEVARSRDSRMVSLVGRLRPGASIDDARRELARAGAEPVALMEELDRRATPALLLLSTTSLFVLLIACANASHLALAGILGRGRELALRGALGGSRIRIGRQLLAESTLLALAGAVLGLVLASAAIGPLSRFAEPLTPRPLEARLDLPVLGFALGLALAAGLLVGGIAAGAARGGAGTRAARGGTPALIVVQIAISLALLVGAGVTLQSFYRLSRVDAGFHAERVVAALLDLDWHEYDRSDRIREFHRRLLAKLAADPGISSVALGRAAPLHRPDGPHAARFRTDEGIEALLDLHAATPEYFATLGVPVIAGRTFGPSDEVSAPAVAIVDRAAAERLWPGRSPLGKILRADGFARTVVGEVGDVRHYGVDTEAAPSVYLPLDQFPFRVTTLVVRASAEPAAIAETIERAVRAIDPDQAVAAITTLERARRESIATPRRMALVLSGFAALALAITSAGLAGSLGLVVLQRRREIGLRVALGAVPRDVSWMILRRGLGLLLAGVLLGLPLALSLSRLLSDQLFEVEPYDPRLFTAVAVFLGAIAGAASILPVKRAVGIDPLSTIRLD